MSKTFTLKNGSEISEEQLEELHQEMVKQFIERFDSGKPIGPMCLPSLREEIRRLREDRDELLTLCEFALEVIGRQSQFFAKDPCLARLVIDIEAVVTKMKGGDEKEFPLDLRGLREFPGVAVTS